MAENHRQSILMLHKIFNKGTHTEIYFNVISDEDDVRIISYVHGDKFWDEIFGIHDARDFWCSRRQEGYAPTEVEGWLQYWKLDRDSFEMPSKKIEEGKKERKRKRKQRTKKAKTDFDKLKILSKQQKKEGYIKNEIHPNH